MKDRVGPSGLKELAREQYSLGLCLGFILNSLLAQIGFWAYECAFNPCNTKTWDHQPHERNPKRLKAFGAHGGRPWALNPKQEARTPSLPRMEGDRPSLEGPVRLATGMTMILMMI